MRNSPHRGGGPAWWFGSRGTRCPATPRAVAPDPTDPFGVPPLPPAPLPVPAPARPRSDRACTRRPSRADPFAAPPAAAPPAEAPPAPAPVRPIPAVPAPAPMPVDPFAEPAAPTPPAAVTPAAPVRPVAPPADPFAEPPTTAPAAPAPAPAAPAPAPAPAPAAEDPFATPPAAAPATPAPASPSPAPPAADDPFATPPRPPRRHARSREPVSTWIDFANPPIAALSHPPRCGCRLVRAPSRQIVDSVCPKECGLITAAALIFRSACIAAVIASSTSIVRSADHRQRQPARLANRPAHDARHHRLRALGRCAARLRSQNRHAEGQARRQAQPRGNRSHARSGHAAGPIRQCASPTPAASPARSCSASIDCRSGLRRQRSASCRPPSAARSAAAQVLQAKLSGKKGQRLIIDVEAQRLGSGLKPVVRLYDARGTQIAWSPPRAVIGGDARSKRRCPPTANTPSSCTTNCFAPPATVFSASRSAICNMPIWRCRWACRRRQADDRICFVKCRGRAPNSNADEIDGSRRNRRADCRGRATDRRRRRAWPSAIFPRLTRSRRRPIGRPARAAGRAGGRQRRLGAAGEEDKYLLRSRRSKSCGSTSSPGSLARRSTAC